MKNLSQSLPLVSVLVPVYNSAKTIKRCIKSILKQSYVNLEIVLVDDGSTDNSLQIMQTIAEQDPRIKIFTKQNEKNISKTRNFLLNHYSGEYVVWVDSDDVVHPQYVNKLYRAINSTGADLGVCRFDLMLANFPLVRPWFKSIKVFTNEAIYANVLLNHRVGFTLWNKIFKHEIIKTVRFDENVLFGEDFVFVFNYLKQVKQVAFTNDKLYKYITHAGSETNKNNFDKKMTFIAYLEDLLRQETCPYIQKDIASWLAFSGITMLFLAKKGKYQNKENLQKLYDITHKYVHNFRKNKNVKLVHRLIMFFGLKFWARKPILPK